MNAQSPMTAQSSGELQLQIDDLERERADAVAALDHGENNREAILLSGDDKKSERHDLDMGRHRRAVERVNLRLPALRDAFGDAQQREAAERQDAARASVEAEIAAFAMTFEAEYQRPAAQIAKFCREWRRIDGRARAAGVDSLHLRFCVDTIEGRPAAYREEIGEHYIDELGNPTQEPYSTGSDGIRRQEPQFLRKRATTTKRVKVVDSTPTEFAIYPSPPDAVNLPGVTREHAPAWAGNPNAEPYFSRMRPQ